jgi:hypothetical protein
MKLPGPRAFRSVMMMVITVVVASFFTMIDAISGRNSRSSLGSSNGCGRSSAELELYGRGWSSNGVDRSRAWMSTQSRGHSRSTLAVQKSEASDMRNRDVA